MTEKEPKVEQPTISKILPIAWPKDVPATYANNVLAQKDGGMLVLSFFQVNPPYLVAQTDEDRAQLLKEVESVNALAVAKLAIPFSVVAALIRVIQSQSEPANETDGAMHGDDPT